MAYLGKTPSQAVRSRYYFTATGGETSLSGTDDNSNTLTFTDGNYVDVALNGVTLVAGTDYNTTTTNTIGGLTALVASDVVEVIVYDTFSVFGGNMAANLNFKDNVKANFGTGNDLVIYHDGSNSIINDAGTGNLQLQLGGSNKLEVTSTGVDVTGSVTANDIAISDTSPTFSMTDTDTNALFRVSASSAVGSVTLEVDENGVGSNPQFLIQGQNVNRFRIDADSGDISFYDSAGTNAKFFWDASAESLGIGTNSLNTYGGKLNVTSGSAGGETTLVVTNNNANQFIRMGINADVAQIAYDNADSLAFGIATDSTTSGLTTEHMRLDSSGNLLVGKTTLEYSSNAGHVLRNDGLLSAVRSGGNVVNFNRLSSDGEIIQLNKDGTQVGSIGVGNASSYTYIGTGDTGLMFNSGNDFLQPWNPSTNATRDAAIDIGRSSSRFKDLYLSGGVYLGGTGSANHLDDYEEGTWTPVDGSGAGLSFTQGSTANYIKIGRLVLFNLYVTYPSTSNTATASIGGLPYAVTSSGYFYANYRAQTLGASNLLMQLNQGSTVMSLYTGDSGYANASLSGAYLLGSGSYMTS